jgi:acyl carrier protein
MSFPQTSAGNEVSAAVEAEIGQLMRDRLGVDAALPDDDLIASGVLDSLTLVQLLFELEGHMGVTIPLSDLQIDEVRSIASLARLVSRHRHACAGPVGAVGDRR